MMKRHLLTTAHMLYLVLCVAWAISLSSNICHAQSCKGDLDNNGTVDGSDLADFSVEFGATDCDTKALSPIPKTGQTASYSTGDDGYEQAGVSWPNPRFTDNYDGTVTDNLTGLIWLKNANCGGDMDWADAISYCNNLADGSCSLSDGSIAGDWRLPNIAELQSLINYGYYNPALSNTEGTGKWSSDDPFTNVQSFYYWSSTTYASITSNSWLILMGYGHMNYNNKSFNCYVWPIRGGQ